MTNLATIFHSKPSSPSFRRGHWRVETRPLPSGENVGVLFRTTSIGWERYSPATEAPEAYLRFASLRNDLWDSESDPSSSIQTQALLDFVIEYGPPYMGNWPSLPDSDTPGKPDSVLPIRLGLFEAGLLATVLRSYQALEEDWDRYHPGVIQVLRGQALQPWLGDSPLIGELEEYEFKTPHGLLVWILSVVNSYDEALPAISPTLEYASKEKWQPGYKYRHLLALMWLQLYEAILRHSPLRRCEGCQVLFEALRPNQMYHDGYCRGAANARRSYRRKKNQQQGG